MQHSRDNETFHVVKNFVERLAILRRLGGQRGLDRARLCVRRDTKLLNVFAIIGEPVGKLMQLFAKFRKRNIAELGLRSVRFFVQWRLAILAAMRPPSNQSRPIPLLNKRLPNG